MRGTYIKLTQSAHWMPKHPAILFTQWHGKLSQLNLLWALTGELKPDTFTRYADDWNEICRLCATKFEGEALAVHLAGTTPAQALEVMDKFGVSAPRLKQALTKLATANAKS